MSRKNVISFLLSLVFIVSLICFGFGTDVHAEDVAIMISYSPAEVNVGDTVTATVTISGENISNYNINLTYTTGILQYQSDAGDSGSIPISGSGPTTLSYKFSAVGQGKATVATTGTEIYDASGNVLSVAHAGANINVGTPGDSGDEDAIKIGNESYTIANEYNHIQAPKDYELSYVTYKDKDIYAYQAPNHKIKVVCLQNAEWEQSWFVYDEKKQTFSPFIEYSLEGVSYVVMNKPSDVKVPEGYEETNLTLDETQVIAYKDKSDSGLYLVYAMNHLGNMDFYFYDLDENSFTRYSAVEAMINSSNVKKTDSKVKKESEEEITTEVKYATPLIADEEEESDPEDEGLISRNTLKNLLTMMIILFVIMCIVVIILMIRNGNLQNQLYGEEAYDDDDDDLDDEIVTKAKDDARKQIQQEQSENVHDIPPAKPKISRNKGYAVNEDTGEILLEEAMDNNAGVNVPPAQDKKVSKIDKAMESKPYGIDSAFDVANPGDAPEGDHVYVEKHKEKVKLNDNDIEVVRKDINKKAIEKEMAENKKKYLDEEITEKITEENAFTDITDTSGSVDTIGTGDSSDVNSASSDLSENSEKTSDSKNENESNSKKKNKKRRRNKRRGRNKQKNEEDTLTADIVEKDTESAEKSTKESDRTETSENKSDKSESPKNTSDKSEVSEKADDTKKDKASKSKKGKPDKVILPRELDEEDE